MNLETTPGLATRPTTDRVKETLFNMLQPYLADCAFLDLFAGSGAIGIEALSRGAGSAFFVERDPEAIGCIRRNLTHTKLAENAVTAQLDVIEGIRRAEQEERVFDVVFMDPPYRMELERRVLERLANSSVITEDTLIVVEAALETDFDYVSELGYKILREKRYKTNKHIFMGRMG